MTDADAPQPPADGAGAGRAVPTALLGIIAVAVIAIGLLLTVFLVGDDGDDDDTGTTDLTTTSIDATTTVADTTTSSTSTSTTTTMTSPSSSSPTTSTTVAPTSTTSTTQPPGGDTATAIWPWVDSEVRYDDPVEAARGFALDFIGFTDPMIGDFLQGDSRSGEVEVRSIETFAATTVFVRQLGPDDSWWVIGSATDNIVVDAPEALATITSPLTVSGRSSAFEGTVAVEIRADGADEPILESFVTGGGFDGLGPFADMFTFPNPGGGAGAIVFQTTSSDDGRVLEAGVIRVFFAVN